MAVISYDQAKDALNRGEIPAFLLLYGEDRFRARELIRGLRNCLQAQIDSIEYLEWGEETESRVIAESLETLPLGGAGRLVVIAYPDISPAKPYLKVSNPRLVAVFLLEKKPGKKDLSALDEHVWAVECKPLKGKDLSRWMQAEAASRGKELPAAAAEYLRFTCGESTALLSREIEKASLYVGQEQRRISMEVLQNTGSRTVGRTIFELVDAVAERKGDLALEVMQELLAQGKPPVLLVSLISRHFIEMLEAYWLLEEGLPPRELSEVMGLHPFAAKKLTKHLRSYRLPEIEKIMYGLLKLDLSLKKGKASPQLMITSFLGEYCALNG